MQYISEHEKQCQDLLRRAEKHIRSTGIGRTYLCRKAGVQIHALSVLKRGTATPKTMQKLAEYLDELEVKPEQGDFEKQQGVEL